VTESEAVVARIDGEFALVELCGDASCGQCGSRHACGVSMDDGRGPKLFRLPNIIGARAGDRVMLTVPAGAVLKAAALSYLIPVLAALAGAAAGNAWYGDPGALLGAGLGLVVGMILLRLAGGRLQQRREPMLTMQLKRHVVSLQREP
jgi:sigma-E factor negative regulatory protein RseC